MLHAACGGIGAYGAVPVWNTLGTRGFAAEDRRQVAAEAGVACATATDRATRGLHDDGGGLRTGRQPAYKPRPTARLAAQPRCRPAGRGHRHRRLAAPPVELPDAR